MLKKYFAVFTLTLQERIEYRARVVIWILVDLLFLFVFPFIWLDVFHTAGKVGEFTEASIVTYYIGVAVINSFVITFMNFEINDEIRDGVLTNYLVRPFSYTVRMFFRSLAMKMMAVVLFIPFLLAALTLFRHLLIFPKSFTHLLFVCIAIVLAGFLCFTITLSVGFVAFFLEDARGMSDLLFMAISIFAGGFAPLSLFPPFFRAIAEALPFQYLVYFPLNMYLGHVPYPEILKGMMMQILWIMIFFGLAAILWHRGVRRYSAVGR